MPSALVHAIDIVIYAILGANIIISSMSGRNKYKTSADRYIVHLLYVTVRGYILNRFQRDNPIQHMGPSLYIAELCTLLHESCWRAPGTWDRHAQYAADSSLIYDCYLKRESLVYRSQHGPYASPSGRCARGITSLPLHRDQLLLSTAAVYRHAHSRYVLTDLSPSEDIILYE